MSEIDRSDDMIRAMLDRRARRGTDAGLREAIVAAIGTTDRVIGPVVVPGRRMDSRGPRLLLVAAALPVALAATVLLSIAGSRDTPAPSAAPSAIPSTARATARPTDDAVRSVPSLPGFEYAVPEAADLKVARLNGPMIALTHGIVGPNPYSDDESDPTGSAPGTWGITVTALADPQVHPCPAGGPRTDVRTDPAGLLDDLRTIAQLGLGAAREITFDGRPAIAADLDASQSRCTYGDVHVTHQPSSAYVALTMPSRLIVTRIRERTVVIQVWGGSKEDLEAWLPMAEEVISSFHFTDRF